MRHLAKGYNLLGRGVADKSLARPGNKQMTATNLGIYSTYSPRSSVQFLTSCSNVCKILKEKIGRLSVQPVLRGSNDFHVGRKMANFQLFFKTREQVGVRRGQILGIGCVIKALDAQVGQFLLGCKCLVRRGHCRARKSQFVNFPGRFTFKMSFNCTSRND